MTMQDEAGFQPGLTSTNPYQTDQINQAVAAAMGGNTPDVAAAAVPVAMAGPPDTQVELMVGIADLSGIKNTAEVRELNGADEEALSVPSLTKNASKYLGALVQRGTVSIGGEAVTKDQLGGLLIGDRELLLFGIRKATYGHEVELITRCPNCRARDEDYKLDLNEVPRRELENIEDGIFGIDITLPSGKKANISLPRSADQDAILQAEGKNDGELNTLMLTRCLKTLGGQQAIGPSFARSLGIKDRNFILKELQDRAPGPRLQDVKRVCGSCEEEFPLNLTLLDIFRV